MYLQPGSQRKRSCEIERTSEEGTEAGRVKAGRVEIEMEVEMEASLACSTSLQAVPALPASSAS